MKILLVVFSPFIGLMYVFTGLYWAVTWLLTPVYVVLHLAWWPIGCLWITGVRLCGATGRSDLRRFKPIYPRFPQLWAGQYWKRRRRYLRTTIECVVTIAALFN